MTRSDLYYKSSSCFDMENGMNGRNMNEDMRLGDQVRNINDHSQPSKLEIKT